MKNFYYVLIIMALVVSSCGNDENPSPINDESFTDMEALTLTDYRDDNIYKIVKIGDQVWMAENLKYLPSVVGPFSQSDSVAHYYVYDYDGTDVAAAKSTENYNNYGVMYNWNAINPGGTGSEATPSGVRGICPSGWHLPSYAEWEQLFNHLGGTNEAGGKLKQKGTTHWKSPNWEATNQSGFSGLPGGILWSQSFIYLKNRGNFWSVTEEGPYKDVLVYRQDNDRSEVLKRSFGKEMAMCVRCVMD